MRPYGLTSFALRHEILGRRSVTPALATWLAERFKVEALSLRDIGLRDAPDMEIFLAAQQAGIVVISKDSDFVELVSRYGTPPQLVWVTCGNVSNRRL